MSAFMLTSDVALLRIFPSRVQTVGAPDALVIQDLMRDALIIAKQRPLCACRSRRERVALHTKTPGFTEDAARGEIFSAIPRRRSWGNKPLVVRRSSPVSNVYRAYLSRLPDLTAFCSVPSSDTRSTTGWQGKLSKKSLAASCVLRREVVTTLPPSQVQGQNIQALITGFVQEEFPRYRTQRTIALSRIVGLEDNTGSSLNVLALTTRRPSLSTIRIVISYFFEFGRHRRGKWIGILRSCIGSSRRPLGNLVEGVRALEGGDFHSSARFPAEAMRSRS